nr:hypothetical protein [Microbacterium sp. NIBRBAC000506063]
MLNLAVALVIAVLQITGVLSGLTGILTSAAYIPSWHMSPWSW